MAMPKDRVLELCGLDATDLDRLRAYGDVLLPANGDAPRFSDADPTGEVMVLTLEQVGHRFAQILEILADTPGATPAEQLQALESARPDKFTYLRDLLVCCYLSTPTIWQILGYDGRKERLPAEGEAEMYLAGGILDPVIAVGPIYTQPPN